MKTPTLEEILISDDRSRLQPGKIREMLLKTYWAKERSLETVEKTLAHSLCFGAYAGERQVGFARCLTDHATIFWLADVVVEEEYRGRGIARALVEAAVNHPTLRPLNGILATCDAHGLYQKFGFEGVDGCFMRRQAVK